MFKDIKGYEGLYQINERAEVKSLIRKKGGLLKPDVNNCGYLRITLCKNGKTKRFFLHRLVYETFIAEIPKGLTIHHIDENKANNHINNLLACTTRQNNHFSAENKGYKLTQSDVDYIRASNLTTKQVTEKYRISPRHALRIIKNERWVE